MGTFTLKKLRNLVVLTFVIIVFIYTVLPVFNKLSVYQKLNYHKVHWYTLSYITILVEDAGSGTLIDGAKVTLCGRKIIPAGDCGDIGSAKTKKGKVRFHLKPDQYYEAYVTNDNYVKTTRSFSMVPLQFRKTVTITIARQKKAPPVDSLAQVNPLVLNEIVDEPFYPKKGHNFWLKDSYPKYYVKYDDVPMVESPFDKPHVLMYLKKGQAVGYMNEKDIRVDTQIVNGVEHANFWIKMVAADGTFGMVFQPNLIRSGLLKAKKE